MSAERLLVTGGSGFLGTAVCAELVRARKAHSTYRVSRQQSGHDLRTPADVERAFQTIRPTHVLHLAYPGTDGIGTALTSSADLTRDMLRIDLNVIDACARHQVRHLVTVGSVCAYPEKVAYPTEEHWLWKGPPETLNAPYGVAKRMQLTLLDAYRRQYRLLSTHLILGNLYGPGDRSGHVIPALITRCAEAVRHGRERVVVWGDGTATREFLYIDDAARGVIAALNAGPYPLPVNLVSGVEIPIRRLIEQIAALTSFKGTITWDPSKPNGQPRRWFSRRRALRLFNWEPEISFSEGLERTVAWLVPQLRSES